MLALIAAAAVLAVSAVAIVSLKGDDKPEITNELPGENEQPASTPQTVYKPVKVEREFAKFVPRTQSVNEGAADDTDSGDDSSDGADGGDDTGGSEDEPGQGDSDDGTPGNSGDDKKHGLERAIEVHEINLARKQAQVEERNLNGNGHGHGDGHGLENSLEHLQENLAKHAGADAGAELDHADNGNGKAKGN
ncbi:MAG: hypothetical protein QXQ13_08120 [Thermoplasmata archaeon]